MKVARGRVGWEEGGLVARGGELDSCTTTSHDR